MRRPAEITSVAGAYAFLALYLLDRVDDPKLLLAAVVVVGHLPAAVTWIVSTLRGERRGGAR